MPPKNAQNRLQSNGTIEASKRERERDRERERERERERKNKTKKKNETTPKCEEIEKKYERNGYKILFLPHLLISNLRERNF